MRQCTPVSGLVRRCSCELPKNMSMKRAAKQLSDFGTPHTKGECVSCQHLSQAQSCHGVDVGCCNNAGQRLAQSKLLVGGSHQPRQLLRHKHICRGQSLVGFRGVTDSRGYPCTPAGRANVCTAASQHETRMQQYPCSAQQQIVIALSRAKDLLCSSSRRGAPWRTSALSTHMAAALQRAIACIRCAWWAGKKATACTAHTARHSAVGRLGSRLSGQAHRLLGDSCMHGVCSPLCAGRGNN